MLNPRVGEIVSIGSPLNRLRIVVLPALSRPLKFISYKKIVNKCNLKLKTYSNKIRISFSFCRIFFKTVRNPILNY